MADNTKLYAAGGVAIGSLFVYSAIKGKSVLSTAQQTVKGQNPISATTLPNAEPFSTPSPTTAVPVISGSTYSHAELMTLWIGAGGNSGAANNAACHAIQESGGRPGVTSGNPDGGTNVGLWQLDTKGKGAGYSIAELKNPLINARVAIKGSSNGADWSAWATPGC
jgi:hypothetical protein